MSKIKKYYNEFMRDLRADPMSEDLKRWDKARDRVIKEEEERKEKEEQLFKDVKEVKILLQKLLEANKKHFT